MFFFKHWGIEIRFVVFPAMFFYSFPPTGISCIFEGWKKWKDYEVE
jgi:hypothetical protein